MKKNNYSRKELVRSGSWLISVSCFVLASYSLSGASSARDNEIINTITAPNESEGCAPFSPGVITGNNPANTSCDLTSYQWIRKEENNNDWENIVDGTEQNYEPDTLEHTTHFSRIVILNCDGIEKDAVVDTSNTVTITVYPQSVGGTITPASTDVCSGANSTQLNLVNHLGVILKWQYMEVRETEWIDTTNTDTQYTIYNLTKSTQYRALVQNEICDALFSEIATIIVVQPPTIEMNLYDTICPGDTLFLNPVITGQWQNVIWNHDGSGSFTNPIVTPTSYASSMSDAGETITLTIKVFADGSCAGTTIEKELQLYVHPHTTIEIEGETTVCANERGVTYTMEQEGFFNLLWKVEHGEITGPANTNEITVNWHNLPGQTGVITLQATNQATQCKSSTVYPVNFGQASAIDPPEIIGKPISNPVVLICNMYGIDTDGFSYKWYRNDALIPGADQQFYYPINPAGTQPESEDFYVMVATPENCITKSETFEFELKKTEELPNNQFFRIYPNPARNELNFELLPFLYITGPAKYIVRIHDLSGKTVHQETMDTDANRINGLDLPAGIYFLTLSTKGLKGIQKLVIIK